MIRHLPPAIISGILVIASCLGVSKSGSKIVGIIAIIYGILASLVAFNIARLLTITVATIFGIIIALIVGIAALILGYKTYKVSS